MDTTKYNLMFTCEDCSNTSLNGHRLNTLVLSSQHEQSSNYNMRFLITPTSVHSVHKVSGRCDCRGNVFLLNQKSTDTANVRNGRVRCKFNNRGEKTIINIIFLWIESFRTPPFVIVV